MLDLTKNLVAWRSAGITALEGVSRDRVTETFRSIDWAATPDVVDMYAQIGGMRELDSECWRLWSLDEIKAANAERSPHGVYFSDYLADCWQFMLKPNGATSAVLRDNFDGSDPFQVADSLQSFFAKILSNPLEVLEFVPRR